jgi:hypothetical protein
MASSISYGFEHSGDTRVIPFGGLSSGLWPFAWLWLAWTKVIKASLPAVAAAFGM